MKDWREQAARVAIRERERSELKRLVLELVHARAQRSRALRDARSLCKRSRLVLRERLKERRRLERERLKREAEAARLAERASCKARAALAKRRGDAGVTAAKNELTGQRAAQRLARRQAARKVAIGVPRSARIHESDDAARRDIPRELQGVWDRSKSNFKSGGRRSRAEAFLEWAEANPGEVLTLQEHAAEKEVERLIREHAQHAKKMKLRKTRAEIERELKAVPF